MSKYISKFLEWVFGEKSPENRTYLFDKIEEDGYITTMVMDHPNPLKRKHPLDVNSEASSSEGSLVEFTKKEYEDATRMGIIRPKSRLKLKYKRRK